METIKVCSKCGSDNVQTLAWVNPNSKLIDVEDIDFYAIEFSENNWCDDCHEHVILLEKMI